MAVSEALTSQQILAAQILALGQSHRIAAERVGVTKITITRWVKKPEFKQKIEEFKQEISDVQKQTFKNTVQEEVSETVETNVKQCISIEKLKLLFSEIAQDETLPLAHRIKAGTQLGKWMGLEAPKPVAADGRDDFPIQGLEGVEDLKHLSDEELQRRYLETLAQA